MKDYTNTDPEFSDKVKILEITDTDHADNFNEATKQLLDNDIVLKILLDKLKQIAYTGSYNDLTDKPDTGVQTLNIAYAVGDSATEPPGEEAEWTDTAPTVIEGKYLWLRITATYADETDEKFYIVSSHIHNYAAKSKYDDIAVSIGRKENTTVGSYSFAFGYNVEASNAYSHAEGSSTTASGNSSHAEGNRTAASGNNSHAEGYYTTASNAYSHAEGSYTTASGYYSHAEGSSTTASGYYSHAEGYYTTASGDFSHAEGYYTTASGDYSHAGGKYNVDNSSNIFSIGIGISNTAKKNGLSLSNTGVLKTASTITASTTADYAEYFEWLDGNPDNEDRVGKFVTLDCDKIKFANEDDTYILGVVSGEPFVLGNGDCDVWNGMNERDLFGRVIYDTKPKIREIPVEDKETGELKIELQEVYDKDGNLEYEEVARINPNYDSTKEYIPRAYRKEWSPIGMLGMLSVYDDGTCEVNGYCKCNNNAIATKSETGYRVIGRLTKNIIRVIIK